jgi:hypothetical protein
VTLTRSPIANVFNEFVNDSNIAIAPPQSVLELHTGVVTEPQFRILTHDSRADTLRVDIAFFTIRIPRRTSGRANSMKIPMRLLVMLLAGVILASGCAAFSHHVDEPAQRINWREYNDC